jgi:photosystem II stability/assembly factor-like uncharacterized protein
MNGKSVMKNRSLRVGLFLIIAIACFFAGALTYRQRVMEKLAVSDADTTSAVPMPERVWSYDATAFPARYVNVGPMRDATFLVGTCSSSPPAVKRCFVYISGDGRAWRLSHDFDDSIHTEVPLVFAGERGLYATVHPNPVELWRSSDGGASWSKVFSHPTERTIYCMAETKDHLIIATWPEGKIFRSTDGVSGWECVFESTREGFFSLLAIPAAGAGASSVVFAGSGNVLRSTDGGATWKQVGAGTIGPIRALFADSTGSVYGLADNGLMTSRDGGENWQSTPYALARGHLCHFTVMHRGCMYAGGEAGTVFRSCDGGKTWETFFALPQAKDTGAPMHVRGITAFGDDIYVGTSCYKFSGEPKGYLYRIPAATPH